MKDKKYHARQIVKKSLLIVLCLSPFLIPAIIFSPWIFLLTIVVVTLKGGDGFMNHVQCVFDKKDRSKIGNMRKGEYLTVAGICSGTIFGGVIVKKCSTFP